MVVLASAPRQVRFNCFAAEWMRGSQDFAVAHNGVTYYLASAAEQQQFRANPDRYIPAYGGWYRGWYRGWCGGWSAFGMAVDDKFPVHPHNFKIVNGKLDVFLKNKDIDARVLWNKRDGKELIGKTAAHWKKVSGGKTGIPPDQLNRGPSGSTCGIGWCCCS
jgi:hypothetical protein